MRVAGVLALGAAVIGNRSANADKLEQAMQLSVAVRWIYTWLFVVAASLVI